MISSSCCDVQLLETTIVENQTLIFGFLGVQDYKANCLDRYWMHIGYVRLHP